MKKGVWLLCLLLTCFWMQGQAQKYTRNAANLQSNAITARKISIRFTDGLKVYYAGNTAEAIKIFEGILLDQPKHDASYFMLSKIYTDKNQLHEANDALANALKIDKNNVWYKLNLAELNMKLENYSEAAKLYEQVCKEKDNNEYYLYALSQAYLEMEKYDKVIDTYNRMEKILGYTDELTNAKVSIWLYMNKIKEAVGEYDQLIKVYPHNADYYVKAGNIYQTNGMMQQAMNYYNKALEINPNDPRLNLTLASYWEQSGNKEKQMQCLLKAFESPAIPISEKTPIMKRQMTEAVRSLQKSNIQLVEQLAKALTQAHPDAPDGYAFEASLCLVQKKYADAKSYFEQSIGIDNTSYSLWEDYCYVLDQLQQWPSLIKYEQDIVQLFPTNAILISDLGRAFVAAKQPDKALEYLKQAAALAFDADRLAFIYNAMGDAYQQKGNHTSALEYWKKAQQKGMNTPELQEKIGK